MGVKNVDFKEFGVKYGEKVGLGVGLGLMVLLCVWGFSSSSGTHASDEQIQKNGKAADNAIRTARVDDTKLIPEGTPSERELNKRSTAFNKVVPAFAFKLIFPFYVRTDYDDLYRRNPNVYQATDMVGAPVHLAIRARQILNDQVTIIDDKTADLDRIKHNKGNKQKNDQVRRRPRTGFPGMGPGGAGPGMGPGFPGMGPGGGGPGMGPGFPGMGPGGMGPGGAGPGAYPPGMGGPGAGGPPPGMNPGGGGGGLGAGGGGDNTGSRDGARGKPGAPGGEQNDGTVELVSHARQKPVADLRDDEIIAETLIPSRGVLVVGAFPHKAQMEEIAKALKLDMSQVNLLYSGLGIQRRIVVPKNKRLPDGTFTTEEQVWTPNGLKALDGDAGWQILDLKYLKWVYSLTVEFEEEADPKLRALHQGRIVMALPKPQRGSYPELAKAIEKIKETLEKLTKDDEAGKKRREDPRLPRDFDPFNPDAGGPEGPAPGVGPAGTGAPMLAPMTPGGGRKPGVVPAKPGNTGTDDGDGPRLAPMGAPGAGGGEPIGLPEFSIVRFLDLDPALIPGVTYEYRIRVVMQNPNFKDYSNVSDPRFAEDKELLGDWSKSIVRVTMPDEVHLFADERQEKRGLDLTTDKAPIQLHKWLMGVRTPVDNNPVGEWWVERMVVPRGEYIGRVTEAKVIGWVSTKIDPVTNKIGMDSFRTIRNDPDTLGTGALLADFEGSQSRVHQRFGSQRWEEAAPTELLFVDSQGRLMARTLTKDQGDAKRTERFTKWEKWVADTKEKLKAMRMQGIKPGTSFDK